MIQPGLSLDEYQKVFTTAAMEEFPILNDWRKSGYVRLQENHREQKAGFLSLTTEGMGLSDYLGPMLISEEVLALMKTWKA